MTKLIESLKEIGFNTYEAKVYIALLKKHPATGYEISKLSEVPQARTYDTLNVLGDKYDDEVRFDEREAAIRGVHGVPYILFDGEFAVPGAMSIDGFKSALSRALKRQDDKKEVEKATERPHTCGEDGCQLL